MEPSVKALRGIAIVILILGSGLTLMAMGLYSLTQPDAMFLIRPAAVILLVLVLLLNKEDQVESLIKTWRGEK